MLWEIVQRDVDLDCRFPAWPFRRTDGFATVYEFDSVLAGGYFGEILADLAGVYGDAEIVLVGTEPRPAVYRNRYQVFPGFTLRGGQVASDYWRATITEL